MHVGILLVTLEEISFLLCIKNTRGMAKSIRRRQHGKDLAGEESDFAVYRFLASRGKNGAFLKI
jgi:hypothetical protein